MKKPVRAIVYAVGFILVMGASVMADQPDTLPVKGMVTMIDLGANKCIPCKMMAPILEKLQKDYDGLAAIVFLDVWEDHSLGKRFGVRSIPTQIFYDKDGREVYRHVGFMDEKSIVHVLDKLGVPKPNGKS
ncbi:MAG: thioredoxin family protein [Desulfobacterales bacterium]